MHRILPLDMRDLGNKFVKNEFNDHKQLLINVNENDTQMNENLRKFFVEWEEYLQTMVEQTKEQLENMEKDDIQNVDYSNLKVGNNLDITQLQNMTHEQLDMLSAFWDEKTNDIINKNKP